MNARHLVAGEWRDEGDLVDAVNPSTGERASRHHAGSAALAGEAVNAARRAFEAGGWSNAPRRRAAVLFAMADAIAAIREPLARSAVAESGKRTADIHHEIDAAITETRYYAGLARAIFGRTQEVGEGIVSHFAREPIGVAAVIVPWNAPITLLTRSVAPALAAGCTVVVKPAPQTTATNALLIEAMAGVADLPIGVLNSVNEAGTEVGRALVAHAQVDVISFTGSRPTAGHIWRDAEPTMKRLNLELGGKAPAIVFADADLDAAAAGIARAGTAIAGQMCTAITRVLVDESVHDDFAERLAARLAAMKVRPATDPACDMGPVISRASRDRLLGVVEEHAARARLRGGVPADAPAGGHYLTPSLIEADDLASPLIQEELFGPVLTLERFGSEAEAAHRANATVWGLSASVWTRDGARQQRMARALKAGTVWLNCHNRHMAEAETGGYRQSGIGRLHGREGLDSFLETKTIFSEPGFTPAITL